MASKYEGEKEVFWKSKKPEGWPCGSKNNLTTMDYLLLLKL